MKLIAEKSICRGVSPVINVKNNPIKYPLVVKYKKFAFACGQGTFDSRHLMIMDILGTVLIHSLHKNKSFSDRIPLPSEPQVKRVSGHCISKKLLEFMQKKLSPIHNGIIPATWYSDEGRLYEIDKNNERIKKPLEITINDRILRDHIPFLKKYSSLEIENIIKDTNKLVFKMSFPVRYFNGKTYKTFHFNNYNIPSALFTLKEIKAAKMSKDNHILAREYAILFNTVLGHFFVQNIFSSYVDFLPYSFYKLSNYAQLFYRLFILTYYPNKKNGKCPNNPISLSHIENRLVLRSKNKTMTRNVVKRILKELKENNFISDPREKKIFGGDFVYSFVKNDWNTIRDKEISFETAVNIL